MTSLAPTLSKEAPRREQLDQWPVLHQKGRLQWRRIHRSAVVRMLRDCAIERGLKPSALRMQAQTAAAAAETSALEAAKHARMSHCIQALTAAQAAAQSFNLVCLK